MAIATQCVSCQHSLNIPEMCLGRKMKCRYCNVLFLMPLPMAGRPSRPILLNNGDATATGTYSSVQINTPTSQNAARMTGIHQVPTQGQVGVISGMHPLVASETGIYSSIKKPGEKTALYPRIIRSQSGTFRPVGAKTAAHPVVRGRRSSSTYAAVGYRSDSHRTISQKTIKVTPIGQTALYPRIKSSGDLSIVPKRGGNDFNVLQMGMVAALIFVGLLGFVFFFSANPSAPKKSTKIEYINTAPAVQVSQKIQDRDTPNAAPVAPAKTLAPVVAPVAPSTPVRVTPVTPSAPGTADALSRAVGELSSNAPVSKSQQAAAAAARGQHDVASKLFQQAAEEADAAGKGTEAQLLSLKSIEERRTHDERGSTPIQTASK